MSLPLAVLGAIGLFVVAENVVTTRRLWASQVFERGQKIAQTLLIWVLPGSFLVVRNVLAEERRARRVTDSTTGDKHLVWDAGWYYPVGSAGYHESQGGGHGHDAGLGGFGDSDGGTSGSDGGSDGGGGVDGGGQL